MNQELLDYYERELIFVKKRAAEFAAEYPDRAAALQISKNGSDDPHVERILEGFALIAGRIQHRMDQQFPEITNSLLELLYPHLARPVPSLGIVQFAVDPELCKQAEGQLVPRGSLLYSRAIRNVQCRFRTVYPVRLWPLEVRAAAFRHSSGSSLGLNDSAARYLIRIELQASGEMPLSKFQIKDLRFRLNGELGTDRLLYETLLTKTRSVLVRSLGKDGAPLRNGAESAATLTPGAIRPVGFERNDAMLPFAQTSFQGYRLLQEYFSFPQKFLFIDIAGLDRVGREELAHGMELLIFVDAPDRSDCADQLEKSVNRESLQLGCTPVANLFAHVAEPIRISHTKPEYQVMPDVHSPDAYEVYSVDRVMSVVPNTTVVKEYRPFYSFEHHFDESEKKSSNEFWCGLRKWSDRKGDEGTQYHLSFVDRNFSVRQPADEAVTIHLTCSNRNVPMELGTDGSWGELDLETGPLIRARMAYGPTPVFRGGKQRDLQWRLISHLSLNHLSLVSGGASALREILRLHNPSETHTNSEQIEGVAAVRSSRKVAHLDSQHGLVFCSGLAIDLELDETRFSGSSPFLLSSILDRFFGLYCSVNSFTQLRVSTQLRKGIAWQWPIRSGEQAIA